MHSKIIGDLVIAILVVGAWFALGLVVVQNGRLASTRVAPLDSSAPAPTGTLSIARDWETVDGPDADGDTVLPTSVCPTPSPTSNSSGSARSSSDKRVLGTKSNQLLTASAEKAEDSRVLMARPPRPSRMDTCNVGWVTDGPNEYQYIVRHAVPQEPMVPGNTAKKIMENVCDGTPPTCAASGGSGGGCAWWSINGDIRFMGLLEENIGIFEFVSGDIFPDGLDGPSLAVPAIFPVALEEEKVLDVVYEMEAWKLSEGSEEILRAVDDDLVDIAKAHILAVRNHELGHMTEVFDVFVPQYVDIINSPPAPDGYYYSTLEAAEAMLAAYYDAWAKLEAEEDEAHEVYESGDGHLDEGNISIPGFEGITCIGVDTQPDN